jgi:hypothetical protein
MNATATTIEDDLISDSDISDKRRYSQILKINADLQKHPMNAVTFGKNLPSEGSAHYPQAFVDRLDWTLTKKADREPTQRRPDSAIRSMAGGRVRCLRFVCNGAFRRRCGETR